MAQDIAIYCVCFPHHEPKRNRKHQKNIMCDATNITPQYRADLSNRGFLFDDTEDHISSLNWTLGDLTATYWIWKNARHEVVGTSQYRRFWDKCINKMVFDDNTLYVQKPISVPPNLKEQFITCHGESGITMLENLASANKIPLTQKMLDDTYSLDYVYGCNMFIAHKEIYNRFCEILFDIVFTIHREYGDEIKDLGSLNRRLPAFLAERVTTSLIINKEHFFPGLKISTVKWRLIKPSWFHNLINSNKKN